MAIEPVKSREQREFHRVIKRMVEVAYDGIRLLISDRETALTSLSFMRKMKKDFNINFMFLKSRSKSFLAERGIRTAKEALSIACSMNKSKKWTEFIEPFLKSYNSKRIKGTTYKRSSVNRNNYMDFLRQVLKADDASIFFNVSSFSDKSLSGKNASKIWKFKVGEKVLLSQSADYTLDPKNFPKKSVTGAYPSGVIYEVTSRKLKTTSDMFLTPVYEIKGPKGEMSGIYYQTELVPALFD